MYSALKFYLGALLPEYHRVPQEHEFFVVLLRAHAMHQKVWQEDAVAGMPNVL